MRFPKWVIYGVAVLLAGILCPTEAAAFTNLSTDNGLSNRRVYGAAKDARGFIWLATRVGVDRWDGETITHYKLVSTEDGTDELINVKGICSDRQGNIYVWAGLGMVFRYRERSDAFTLVLDLNAQRTGANYTAHTLYFDIDNTLWIGCHNTMIHVTGPQQWETQPEMHNTAVYEFCSNARGDLWTGTSKGVFFKKRLGPGHYEPATAYAPVAADMGELRVESLFYDDLTSTLWIGTFNDGLYTYNYDTGATTHPEYIPSQVPVRAITRVGQGEVWIGTDGGGVITAGRFDSRFLSHYTTRGRQPFQLSGAGIYDIFEDEEVVLICTYTGGVDIYDPHDYKFRYYRAGRGDTAPSISDNHVNAIMEDSDGDLWFGTNNGVSVYLHGQNAWRYFLQKPTEDKTGYQVILALCEDASGNVWAGGYATGAILLNKHRGEVRRLRTNTSGLGSNYLYTVYRDPDGDIWFGGIHGTLTRYDPLSDAFTRYQVFNVNALRSMPDGTIVAATVSGLAFIDKHSGAVEIVDLRKGNKEVKTNFLYSLYCDGQGNIIAGSNGAGAYRYTRSEGVTEVISSRQGLSSDFVYGILEDRLGRLWMSGENGLCCYDPVSRSVIKITRNDGLFSETFIYNSYAALRNGNFIFGSTSGAAEFSPEEIKKVEYVPKLFFTDFKLSYRSVHPDDERSPLQQPIDSVGRIRLRHNQNSFSLSFTSIDIKSQGNLLYSWKLEGLDTQWTPPSETRSAVYTNIPYGRYRFTVRSIYADGMRDAQRRTVEIVIRPPFWLSAWAWLLYAAVAAGVAVFSVKFWSNRLEARNSDEKIRFFINTAHDIRTPLTLIKAPLDQVVRQEGLPAEVRAAVGTAIKNTDKLMKTVSQLLDFQKTERKAMRMAIEPVAINDFVAERKCSFDPVAARKRIDLKLELPRHMATAWIDRDKMETVLDNLLSNAIKYTPQGGRVTVRLLAENRNWVVEVEDNGIGIPKNAQKNLFSRFYRADNAINSHETGSGIGLMLARKLIELHYGTITLSSAENRGSLFRASFPWGYAHFNPDQITTRPQEETPQEADQGEGNALPPTLPDFSKGARLLVAEDNDELRAYIAGFLGNFYNVTQAADGAEALEKIASRQPDLVISDVMMPNLAGDELCRRIKGDIETCHIPVILLTALDDKQNAIAGLEAGADDYITKPFDLSLLHARIIALLRNRELVRSRFAGGQPQAAVDYGNEMDARFMERLQAVIAENMPEGDFNIDALSRTMAMSRTVLYRKVKALTGYSPNDFVRLVRMRRAAELLRQKRYPISEIAEMTGFSDAKYFSTTFKKVYGISPSNYNG